MRLQVTHRTHYFYRPSVETAQHMAYLQPCEHACQTVESHALTISPQPAQQASTMDVYGNQRCFFSLQVAHAELTVLATSVVQTRGHTLPSSGLLWQAEKERFRYRAGSEFDAATEFVFASAYVPLHAEVVTYAKPSFLPGATLLEAAFDLMQRIHTDFTFDNQSTQVNTPALTALAQRKGVCQDFAHIMLACLRSMGLPARYVSGYLLTEAAPGTEKLVGSDATHAWVSVYIADLPEGARWCDFDPTNNRWGWHAPGVDYVTVATGRDFGDVSPLRGVIHGGASHVLTVGVTVEELAPLQIRERASGQFQSQQQGQTFGNFQSQSQGPEQNPSFPGNATI
jgi:transglutaminase-like putative cysteine protease